MVAFKDLANMDVSNLNIGSVLCRFCSAGGTATIKVCLLTSSSVALSAAASQPPLQAARLGPGDMHSKDAT